MPGSRKSCCGPLRRERRTAVAYSPCIRFSRCRDGELIRAQILERVGDAEVLREVDSNMWPTQVTTLPRYE